MKEYVSYNELKHWGIKGMKWRHKKAQVDDINSETQKTAEAVQQGNVAGAIQGIGGMIREGKDEYRAAKDPGYRTRRSVNNLFSNIGKIKINNIADIGKYIKTIGAGVKDIKTSYKKDKATEKRAEQVRGGINKVLKVFNK